MTTVDRWIARRRAGRGRGRGARGASGALAATALALLTWLAPAIAPSSARAAIASHLTLALGTPVRLGSARTVARRSGYVVLQPWEAAVARTLKRENPHLVVLAYQNFGSMSVGVASDGLSSSGVPFADASNVHHNWFLSTSTGARIQELGYPYLFMADVGDRGYQHRWTADVVRLLRRGPWDGVFMDDVNASPRPEAGSATIAGYPTDAAYERAVGSMLAYAGPRIRAADKLAIANIGDWVDHPAVARSWLRDLDGGMDEQFVKWAPQPGAGYRSVRQWLSQEREVRTTWAMGKRFLAVTNASAADTHAQLYGWASLLLAARGRASYLAGDAYNGTEPWLSAYRARLGRPLGAMRKGPGGIYRRSFASGLVVVNPTDHGMHVAFGGAFSGSGLTLARATTLPGHRALVLVRASVSAAPHPPSHRLDPLVVLALLALALLVIWWRRWRVRAGG
jgi:putative glycosyl hydrolase-like family 15 (GHL15) protein